MPGQGIAPAPGGLRQALGHPAAGTGAGFRRLSGGRLICTSWRLGFRQCSFHHVTRISRHAAPYAWALLPVSWPGHCCRFPGGRGRLPGERRRRHRFQASFRWMDHCIFWRLGFRQFSFRHVARVPQRIAPYAWTRSLVGCHAVFPLAFRRQVRHQTQEHSSKFLPTEQGIR